MNVEARVLTQHTPLLVFADDWGRHPSSCQHLVRRLLDRHRVLWVNTIGTRRVRADAFTLRRGWEKLRSWRKGLRNPEGGLWVLDVPMLPVAGPLATSLNRRLTNSWVQWACRRLKIAHPVLLTTLPHVWPFVNGLTKRGVIYYCVDDFSHWPGADGVAVLRAEQDLLLAADAVLGASLELKSRLSQFADVRYFPHAVDAEHFGQSRTLPIRPEIARLSAPRLGFFGLIYEQLDFELLAAVADRFSHGSLVMIGPVAHCPEWFRNRPNVHFVGSKPYSELPTWLSGLDVLLLAYRKDEMSRQINPLKLKECLATGIPVVSVGNPEASAFEAHIRTADDAESFLTQIVAALTERDHSPLREARRSAVRDDSWERRADELHSIIAQCDGEVVASIS